MPIPRVENRNFLQQIEVQTRRRFMLHMRAAGMSYADIADAAIERFGADRLPNGYDSRYVYKDIRRELDSIKNEVAEKAEEVRELELLRLDELQRRLWPLAVGRGAQGHPNDPGYMPPVPPDYKAVDRVLRIMETRARLWGLTDSDAIPQGKTVVKIIGGFNPEMLRQGPTHELPEAEYSMVEDKDDE